ncbi:MAG TPA: M20/M25/M40 family metallo-hydrolase [Vicinamibacteria bacterium]
MRTLLSLILLAGGALPATAQNETPLWITVGADALPVVKQALGAAPLAVETRGSVALLRVAPAALPRLSAALHDSFRRCPGFLAHDSREAALLALDGKARMRAAQAAFVDYTIDNGGAVKRLLEELRETEIRNTILTLSAFTTRHQASPTGVTAAQWLRDAWLAMAAGRSDVTVELYPHPTLGGQPSVIATIQGTALPSEIVILGGHLDSIVSGGASTSRAPGADDDASGVATITEVLRAAMVTGYRPARTVKFMGYAAEEIGLRGSQEIAAAYQAAGANVVGVLQLDMTNFKGSAADMALLTDFTNAPQNQFLEQLIDRYVGASRTTTRCGYGCSDHASWNNRGYPASMPFEAVFGQHNRQLHTVRDTLTRSLGNANHALKFARLGAAYLAELAKGGPAPLADGGSK